MVFNYRSLFFFLRALQNQRFFCVASGRRGIPQHHQSPIHGSDTRMTGQAGGPQHSLAGRVHLGCVEEVDAALVGDCHQLLSHLGEAKMDTWRVTVPSPPAHPTQGKAPEDAAKGLQRGLSIPCPGVRPFARGSVGLCAGPRSTKTQIPLDSSWQELICSHRKVLGFLIGKQPRI